jgi:hypothetical protein
LPPGDVGAANECGPNAAKSQPSASAACCSASRTPESHSGLSGARLWKKIQASGPRRSVSAFVRKRSTKSPIPSIRRQLSFFVSSMSWCHTPAPLLWWRHQSRDASTSDRALLKSGRPVAMHVSITSFYGSSNRASTRTVSSNERIRRSRACRFFPSFALLTELRFPSSRGPQHRRRCGS